MKKPIYKRWWFIVIAIILVIGIINSLESSDDKQVKKDEPVINKKENKETEVNEVNEESETTIEVDESIASVDYTAKIQRVKVNDDVLTVVFDWENQSDWDPAHFPLLGHVEVKQNGEVLEQVGDTERQNKQIKRNRFDVYGLEYKLIDDSEVTIKIISLNEHDESEGTIKVKLNK